MTETVKDMLKTLTSFLSVSFAERGYLLKKGRFFERLCESGRTRRYTLNLSKNKGWFSLHLTLQLFDPELMGRVNTVLDRALRDERFVYPDNWSRSFIEKAIKKRTSNHVVVELTDWRALKSPEETLEHFNDRFSIWLYSFEKLDEKSDWKEQLLISIRLAMEWFDEVDSDDWIRVFTDYPALYLLSIGKLDQDLEEKYSAVLKFSEDPQEVDLFYLNLF